MTAKGTVWYGLHFYPGVAEYADPKGSYRVFLNEATLRKMDPTFAGRPLYVRHVDEVAKTADEARGEADGWVMESFFNQADGKHWVKFISVTKNADDAIRAGWQLSNAYMPKDFASGGKWNGVDYDKEITDGEYEHLALVPNPRYEESRVLSPDAFKKYNEDHVLELQRIANAKIQEPTVKFFTRKKVENSTVDLETMVELTKSKREVALGILINEADERALAGNVAGNDMIVDLGADLGGKMTVSGLVAAFTELKQNAKKDDEMCNDDEDEEAIENKEDEEEEEEKEEKPEAKKDNGKKKKKNDTEVTPPAPVKNKAKADRVRNAAERAAEVEPMVVETSREQVARGLARYG